MVKQVLTSALWVWPIFASLLFAPVAMSAPAPAQAGASQGSWHVELESRADTADKGQVTYRLTAAQGLVQPDWKPVLTVSDETLTFAPAPGAGPKVRVIKYLSCDVLFREPDLTCDAVTLRLLSPTDTGEVAAKPSLHFRRDFLMPGFSFQLKIPRGFHYVAGSARASRVVGLLPAQATRKFVKPPQYAAVSDPASPHLLSLLLPAPEPRALGTGMEAPYGVEFTLAPD